MTSEDWKDLAQTLGKSGVVTTVIPACLAGISAAGATLIGGGTTQVAMGAAMLAFSAVYLDAIRRAGGKAAESAKDAKDTATVTASEMKKTQGLINGRMDQILADKEKEKSAAVAKAYADGRQAGLALTMQGIAQSDKIPLEAQGVAEVVAKVSSHD